MSNNGDPSDSAPHKETRTNECKPGQEHVQEHAHTRGSHAHQPEPGSHQHQHHHDHQHGEHTHDDEYYPSPLERRMAMFHWILAETEELEQLQQLWQSFSELNLESGEGLAQHERLLEQLFALEQHIFNDYAERALLNRFDFIPTDNEVLEDVKCRFMLLAIIYWIECDLDENASDEDFNQLSDLLLQNAELCLDRIKRDFEAGAETADEFLNEEEHIFLSNYYPELLSPDDGE